MIRDWIIAHIFRHKCPGPRVLLLDHPAELSPERWIGTGKSQGLYDRLGRPTGPYISPSLRQTQAHLDSFAKRVTEQLLQPRQAGKTAAMWGQIHEALLRGEIVQLVDPKAGLEWTSAEKKLRDDLEAYADRLARWGRLNREDGEYHDVGIEQQGVATAIRALLKGESIEGLIDSGR
jgi:hypothetical protein